MKGAWANIPTKSNRNDPICFSPYLYRARNRVERFFNRIKQCRRFATTRSLEGNYRLVVAFDFRRQIAFVKFIGSHAQYDNIDALTVSQC